MDRARLLLSLVLAAVLGLVVAACGGSDGEAASNADVDRLLRDTFGGEKQIDSGRLDVRLELDGRKAGGNRLGGPMTVRVSGPFVSQGEGRLPAFALDAELRGGANRVAAGVTATEDAGFVRFQGQDYALAPQVFRQFRAGYEEAQRRGRGRGGRSFASLGMDPRRWLKDARIAGEATVGDADTIKITGPVDVPALIRDLERALGRARALGLQGAQRLPRLTDAQRRRLQRAVERLGVEIYTGKDDHLLRRLVVRLEIADRREGSGRLLLDLTLTGVNDDQEIPEPSDPRPFADLLTRLRGLGLALGGGGSASRAELEEYSRCVTRAGRDADAARECAALLSP
jgi:hypothetical protein